MKTIIAIALVAAFTWSWASKNEPEMTTLPSNDCFQGEAGVWVCE